MPKRCYVEWCFTGYDSENKDNKVKNRKNKAMFQAPRDPGLRKKWHDAIGRTTRDLSGTDSVCELHFAESDINRFYETLMPDGTIHRIPRRCLLKPGAIPDMKIRKDDSPDSECKKEIIENQHIVVLRATENNPEQISGEIQANIDVSTTQVNNISRVTVERKIIAIQPRKSSDDSMSEKPIENGRYTIDNLRMDLKNSCLPEGWAYVYFNNEGIRFPCWNLNSDVMMMLTVKNDMTGKISIRDGITVETDLLNLTSFDNFTKSLILLRKVVLCEGSGTTSRRSGSCPVIMHLSPKFPRGLRSSRCLPCGILRRQELDAEHRREKTRKNRIFEYQKSLKAMKRQNLRLQTKVSELQVAMEMGKRTRLPIILKKNLTKDK